jgi:starch phosphorylase
MNEKLSDEIPMNLCQRKEITGYHALEALALDLLGSWYHHTDEVWMRLDPVLWEKTHNPWMILQTVSREKLDAALADANYRKMIEDLLQSNQRILDAPSWFQKTHSDAPLSCVAYFSMEFMLNEALPIYSGGLGNVAGDQLKAASDLGVPVVAIGLLYQQGYFRQLIDKEGAQQALYPYNDPGQLPITPLRKPNGEWLRLEVPLPGYSIWLRAWQVQVGRVKLYLLDSNDIANAVTHRGITSELYGGGTELRLKQEMLLGLAGWRLLEVLGINPDVCHLNEGHAAFAILERTWDFMKATGVPFAVALEATRAGNLFTTHTAVPAGFDRFSPALIEQYLWRHFKDKLGISLHELLALGRENPDNDQEDFNMAYLAMRGSGYVNGVSRLHGKVSRQIFEPLFPRWPEADVPVGYITNGVHMPSWDSAGADALWTESCGSKCWLRQTEKFEQMIRSVSDESIWQMRNEGRKALVEFSCKRLATQLEARGVSANLVAKAKHQFDPNILTLGFARRFATYKRPNMLLHDPERLLRILTNAKYPVQLVLAGKAHPADKPGQALIKQWIDFINRPEARSHVIFLSDYDMSLTAPLVQGVDVWINTPRRPWEACGTSGMKVLVNGGLNLSELDGWWAEAYSPEVGWAMGDGEEHADTQAWDAAEAEVLYDLLEKEVIPEFYRRDESGLPRSWIKKIRESMATLTPQYSADRAVREYTETYYLPATENYRKRSADKGALSKKIVDWKGLLNENWSRLRFIEFNVETSGDHYQFNCQLYLNGLDPRLVKVELYTEDVKGQSPEHQEMQLVKQLPGSIGIYQALVPPLWPSSNYTPRVVPVFPGVAVPLETNHILWYK